MILHAQGCRCHCLCLPAVGCSEEMGCYLARVLSPRFAHKKHGLARNHASEADSSHAQPLPLPRPRAAFSLASGRWCHTIARQAALELGWDSPFLALPPFFLLLLRRTGRRLSSEGNLRELGLQRPRICLELRMRIDAAASRTLDTGQG